MIDDLLRQARGVLCAARRGVLPPRGSTGTASSRVMSLMAPISFTLRGTSTASGNVWSIDASVAQRARAASLAIAEPSTAALRQLERRLFSRIQL
ncbi:MAG: hypothetical protein RLO38_02935 [Roseovarius confluentis]|jgi:hypothetical protein